MDISSSETEFLPLTQHDINALALVAHLLTKARQELAQPMPLKTLSVLSSQDAIELFIGIVISIKKQPVEPKATFPKLLQAFEKATGFPDNLKPLERLNVARVGLKHHGNFCDAIQLSEFVEIAERFVSDYSKRLFGKTLLQLNRIDLVSSPAVYSHLKKADEALSQEDYKLTIKESALALKRTERESQFRLVDSTQPFAFARSKFQFWYGKDPLADLARQIDSAMSEEFRAIGWHMLLTSMGVDFRDIGRFRAITPSIAEFGRSSKLMVRERSFVPSSINSRRNAEFAIWFATDVALRFQDCDTQWIEEYGLLEYPGMPAETMGEDTRRSDLTEGPNPSPLMRRQDICASKCTSDDKHGNVSE